MIVATAGHVDHGKTSLVRQLTGVDTDRLDEEKQRGLTIDLGFAYSNTDEGRRLGFIDVPGHIRFINNMLAGVSAVDYALLVVAADDGVMPQTREHLDILKLLDIPQGCVAVTKIDRCSDEQVQATIEGVKSLVAGSFLEGADIYPVSNETKAGFEDLQLELEIAASDVNRDQQAGQFRLAIDRRFTMKGSGIVVTGSVFAGQVHVGDELLLQPQQIPVRVRSLRTQNEAADTAVTGDRCAVNLNGNVELEDISRGNWLTTNPAAATDRLDIRLDLLGSEAKTLRHWTPVHIHTAANHINGRVALLEGTSLAPGEQMLAQLVLETPINVCTGDRVVLRDQAATRTLGGGRVLDPNSPKRGRAKQERLVWLKQVQPLSPEATLEGLLKQQPLGFSAKWFRQAFNLSEDEYQQLLSAHEHLILDEQWLIAHPAFEAATAKLAETLDLWHDNTPGKAGLPLNQIQTLVRAWPKTLVDHLAKAMLDSAALERHGNLLARPGRVIKLSQQEQKIWEKVRPLLEAELTCPPVTHDLAKAVNTEPKPLEKTLIQIAKAGMLIRPAKNRFFLPEGIDELKALLPQAVDDKGELTVQAYRDLTGVGRNLTIEILEFFDRQGITRRQGNARILLSQ